MRFFFFLVFLAIVGIVVLYKYQESHPSKGLFNYEFGEKAQEQEKKPSYYRVLNVYSGADFMLLRDNVETQYFSLVDIDCPNPDPQKVSPEIWGKTKSREELAKIGRTAMEFSKEQLASMGSFRTLARKKGEMKGLLYLQGDISLTNGSSLARELILRGLASGKKDALVSYQTYEDQARTGELGLWSHRLPLKDRIKVDVFIAEKVLDFSSHNQKASMTKDILESVTSEEKAAVVNMSVFIEPPLTRDYEFEVKCDFMMEEVTGYSEKLKKDARIFKDLEHKTERFLVSDAATNLTVKSSSYEMSNILRGGRSFKQGVFCSSCICTISLDGEVIKKENKIFE
ncbi:hypothetical protein IKZ40_02780 [bacterium]|nr:hypothetical protein [bacterium]